MTRDRWHILREPGRYTLARQLPVRWDVYAEAAFPKCHKGRLARQVRQDMWRALRDVRGFSPVVDITDSADTLHIVAGGRVARPSEALGARVRAVLTDVALRRRWLHWARS